MRTTTATTCELCRERPAEFLAPGVFAGNAKTCGPCRARFDCQRCGEIPNAAGTCDCEGRAPKLPRFRPL